METLNINEVYARYKACIDTQYGVLKKRADKAIEQRGLSSVMNDTKWLELQTAILEEPDFEPAYHFQSLIEKRDGLQIFEEPPWSSGAWELIYENFEFAPPPFFTIEWMVICPFRSISRGRLVPPEIVDESHLLVDILNKFHIPYVQSGEHTYVIYGYK